MVGTVRGLRYLPTDCEAAYLRTYKVTDNGKRLELLHKTQIEVPSVPGALHGFKVGLRVWAFEWSPGSVTRVLRQAL